MRAAALLLTQIESKRELRTSKILTAPRLVLENPRDIHTTTIRSMSPAIPSHSSMSPLRKPQVNRFT